MPDLKEAKALLESWRDPVICRTIVSPPLESRFLGE